MEIVLGLLIVIATVYFLIKQYETRMVLIVSGILMALISGAPMLALDAFAERMTTEGLITAICSVMGFAYVMKITKCDQHLVNFIAGFLTKFKTILIPGSVLVTFAINIALPSAAGTAAAVGAILIPVLIAAGVAPAMAATTVFAGTFGSMLSPGLAHNPFIAEIAGMDVMDVIGVHLVADVTAVVIAAISLTVIARFLKEDKFYVDGEKNVATSVEIDTKASNDFKSNPLFAIVPIVPLALLVLGSTLIPTLEMGVPQAMIIGSIFAIIVTRKNPQEVTKAFFNGMGDGYANIFGIIISAGVFVSGMQAIGLIDAFIEMLLNSESIVKVAGTFGPFILGLISGSGDAAAFAFNEAVSPQAQLFGMEIVNMGSLAALGGALGRTMSPIAGAGIVAATMADVNPMELAKRNAPGMIIAAIAIIFIL